MQLILQLSQMHIGKCKFTGIDCLTHSFINLPAVDTTQNSRPGHRPNVHLAARRAINESQVFCVF